MYSGLKISVKQNLIDLIFNCSRNSVKHFLALYRATCNLHGPLSENLQFTKVFVAKAWFWAKVWHTNVFGDFAQCHPRYRWQHVPSKSCPHLLASSLVSTPQDCNISQMTVLTVSKIATLYFLSHCATR
jgi:hypothetical protein